MFNFAARRGNRPAGARGWRAYVVGDIHGRLDLLEQLLGKIEDDLDRRPARKALLAFVGDLIDRGPDSAKVVERLRTYKDPRIRTVFILGNHEEVLLRILSGEPDLVAKWRQFGGGECLKSYGVETSELAGATDKAALEIVRRAIPKEHAKFIEGFDDSCRFGDYLFVHAGIRPGIGIGWNEVEFVGLNEDFHNRGRRSEEQAQVMQALWAERHPRSSFLQLLLGSAEARLGRTDAAIACFRQAVAIRPDNADAHNNLGILLAGLGRDDQAASAFRNVIALVPAHADAYTVKVGFIDDGSVPIERLAAGYAPSNELMGQQLKQPFNFGPQHHYVLQAAIAGLHAWVRAGEAPPHAPRLETDDDQLRMGARRLDGERAEDLVERRLRGPVGVPSAQAIVADRSDARRERGENAVPGARHQRDEVLGHEGGTDGVDGEHRGHRGRIERADRLLRCDARPVQQTAGDEDQPDRSRGADSLGRRRDRGLVRDVDGQGLHGFRLGRLRPREGEDARVRSGLRESCDERLTDPARSSEDDCTAHSAHRERDVFPGSPLNGSGASPARSANPHRTAIPRPEGRSEDRPGRASPQQAKRSAPRSPNPRTRQGGPDRPATRPGRLTARDRGRAGCCPPRPRSRP